MTAEISPCNELIVFITGLNTIILFDKEMNIIDEKPLEEKFEDKNCEELGIIDAVVKWREDSNYFCVNYSIKGGRKSVKKDKYLRSFTRPKIPCPENKVAPDLA